MTTTKPSVLLVDDETSVHAVFGRLFAKMGFDLVSVATGEEGLARMNERTFDVYLLDKNLPKTGGEVLARTARTTNADAVIILITGFATTASADQLVGIADEYLIKPFDLDDVRRTVAALLERRDAQRAARGGPAPHQPSATAAAQPAPFHVTVTPVPSSTPAAHPVSGQLEDDGRPHVHVAIDAPGDLEQLEKICEHLGVRMTHSAGLGQQVPDVLVLAGALATFPVRQGVWAWQAKKPMLSVVVLVDPRSVGDSAAAVALKADFRLQRPINVTHAHLALQRALGRSEPPR